MTLVYLTDDCIYYILHYLQNDHSTLFDCLLVNRFWCKSTIPLLYANPFAKTSKKSYRIILTLISCFDKSEILQLKNQLLVLGHNINTNIDEEHKPLFEYLKYLEDYNCNKINSFIIKWCTRYCSGLLPTSTNKIYVDIIPIFHQSILRHSRNIKQLDILLHLFYKESFKNFNIQNFTSNLTKLNSLSLNFYFKDTADNKLGQEFLRSIANTCLNLRILKITHLRTRTQRSRFQNNVSNEFTLEKLYAIIQEQNKLEMFKIWCCNSILNNILLSLEFQKHSLVHIEIMRTDFSNVNLKRFNNLHNLEYLKFGFCKGILLNQCESLKFVSFKLKELEFIRNYWYVDVTSLMIKYLGAQLQRLYVVNPTILLIDNISMYCPNLISLKIRIIINTDLSFLSSFNNLRIRILNIFIAHNIIDDFFINLANNIPINISTISISHLLVMNINKFLLYKKFLENCHNSFEMINLNYSIDYEFLKIVLNYIERSNNNLKIIGIMGLDKKLNIEEIKLLDQIKAKGVKIVNYYASSNDLCKIVCQGS